MHWSCFHGGMHMRHAAGSGLAAWCGTHGSRHGHACCLQEHRVRGCTQHALNICTYILITLLRTCCRVSNGTCAQLSVLWEQQLLLAHARGSTCAANSCCSLIMALQSTLALLCCRRGGWTASPCRAGAAGVLTQAPILAKNYQLHDQGVQPLKAHVRKVPLADDFLPKVLEPSANTSSLASTALPTYHAIF